MPYCTLADLKSELNEQELVELTDDESSGVVNESHINAAIAKADAKIDFFCGQQVDVPFSSAPPIVKEWSKTLSIYYLFLRKKVIPEDVKTAAKEIFDLLAEIADGEASIPGVSSGDDGIQSSRTEDDATMRMGKASDGSSGTLDNY